MKRIKYILLTLGLITSFGLATVPSLAGAVDPFDDACKGSNADTAICNSKGDKALDLVKTIVNTMLYVLAAVSVIVIIIAGIYYTTSSGDPALVKKAKDTLLYAVVGLIISIMAYAIVHFVIGVFA